MKPVCAPDARSSKRGFLRAFARNLAWVVLVLGAGTAVVGLLSLLPVWGFLIVVVVGYVALFTLVDGGF